MRTSFGRIAAIIALVAALGAGAWAQKKDFLDRLKEPPESAATPLLDKVKQFLTEDDWKFEAVPDTTILRMGFKGDNGNWTVLAQSKEDYEQVFIYSVWTSNVSEDKRAAAAEYVTRANYGLPIGGFEMDLNDGEVRYKTSIDIEGGELTPTMIKNLLYLNVLTFDKYLGGLNKVVFGGVAAADAIKEIEQPADAPEADTTAPADAPAVQ